MPYVVIASSLCLLLICGEIDLSVGQSFAFAPIVMYLAYDKLFLILPLAVLVGLLAVAVVGLVNGLITVYLGVFADHDAGMFFLLAGLNVTLTEASPRPLRRRVHHPGPRGVLLVGDHLGPDHRGRFAARPVTHPVGAPPYATGGNPLGARGGGRGRRPHQDRQLHALRCASGFVGIIESFRINSIDPLAGGPDIVLLCIAAAVMGGRRCWWGRDRYWRVPRG